MIRRRGSLRAAALTLALAGGCALAPPAAGGEGGAPDAEAPGDETDFASARRGRISVGYQLLQTRGLRTNLGTTINTAQRTDTHALNLAIDQPFGERWEAHLSIPFIRKRTRGPDRSALPPGAHTLALVPGHPDAEFIDDGDYHGHWQDWSFGLSYRTQWGAHEARPRIAFVLPSHDYPFYGNAAPGQRLWRLRLGAEVGRRIGLSDAWYSVGYDFEIWQKVLGKNLNKHYLEATLGYAVSPRVSVRLWASARRGQGSDFSQTDRNCRCTFWYQHDRHNRHDFTIGGLGLTWRIDPQWTLSLTGGKMLWGSTVHDLRGLHSVQISRSF